MDNWSEVGPDDVFVRPKEDYFSARDVARCLFLGVELP